MCLTAIYQRYKSIYSTPRLTKINAYFSHVDLPILQLNNTYIQTEHTTPAKLKSILLDHSQPRDSILLCQQAPIAKLKTALGSDHNMETHNTIMASYTPWAIISESRVQPLIFSLNIQ